ncbi:envelope integrity protein Cei [Rhodococcus sp. X156]|uniref:envelope integrity protein Cei n=1 Tax=Rhodococcus sp. X156 TaxID=2499145 RepID=UPI0024089162|nr:envelope integrity protein Cei [Rhodococcus sp. X156]
MVSLSTGSRSPGGPPGAHDGYQRRRPLPAIALLVVLSVLVLVVWVQVLTQSSTAADTSVCPEPTPAGDNAGIEVGVPQTEQGTKITSADLAAAPPSAPQAAQVRVLNANGQRGQASLVAAQLAQLGFTPAPDMASGNDTVFTAQDMRCQAQVRFGEAGKPAARTLQLLVPCAELVQDDRKDQTVDLALGTVFSSLSSDADVTAALTALSKHAADPQTPAPDSTELAQALSVSC